MFVLIDWLVCLCSFTQHCVCAHLLNLVCWLTDYYVQRGLNVLTIVSLGATKWRRMDWKTKPKTMNQRKTKEMMEKVSHSSPQTITWNDELGENNNKDHCDAFNYKNLLTWVSLTGIWQVFNKGFSSDLCNFLMEVGSWTKCQLLRIRINQVWSGQLDIWHHDDIQEILITGHKHLNHKNRPPSLPDPGPIGPAGPHHQHQGSVRE